MVKKGKWTTPGYDEKFGSEYSSARAVAVLTVDVGFALLTVIFWRLLFDIEQTFRLSKGRSCSVQELASMLSRRRSFAIIFEKSIWSGKDDVGLCCKRGILNDRRL